MDGLLFFIRKGESMDSIMYQLVWFVIEFVVIFLIYYFLLLRRLKKKNYQGIGEFSYLIHRFSLDVKKLKFSNMAFMVACINAFIMAFVASFIMLIPTMMIWRLMIGFVLLFALIYSLYEIYGRFLQKRYRKE